MSKLKLDALETVSGKGKITLKNQLKGMTAESLPPLTSDEMPSGSVLQVVQVFEGNPEHHITTSTSHVSSGITASITPKFSNSLIIVNFNIAMVWSPNSWGSSQMHMSTGGGGFSPMASAGDYQIGYMNNSHNGYGPFSFVGNVVTSSLSTLTFCPFVKAAGGQTFYFVHAYGSYALTLTEIKQ